MRVDPEMVREDGVAHGDVAAGPLVVVAVQAEPAQGGGVVEFAEGALGGEAGEDGDPDVVDGCGLGGVGAGRVAAVAEGEGGLVDGLGDG